MAQKSRYATLGHPLAMNSCRLWWRMLRECDRIDPRYRPRAIATTCTSLLLSPFHLIERMLYARRIAATEIEQPPIFIIGACRAGTTHLHNLMAQDPNLGYITLYDIIIPGANIVTTRFLRPILDYFAPDKRPMDNMDLKMTLPQEDEFTIGHLCPYSCYHGWYFPRRMLELYRKYLLFDGISDEAVLAWRAAYRYVLKKATMLNDGKRLILKNPVNTGRIKAVLELFPDAKFIHIHRNPHMIYPSSRRLYRKVLDTVQLQDISEQEIDENMLTIFEGMMKSYLAQKDLIPEGNLVEIRFEDLETRPIEEMARIYSALDIPKWDEAKPHMAAYSNAQKHYAKNTYTITEEDLRIVEDRWGFALEEWGYERPGIEKRAQDAINA